jgi:TusA-related sulfurtransferase
MALRTRDIRGRVCPFCLLAVQKDAAAMQSGDELVVTCDHPPAATESIPQYASDHGLKSNVRKLGSGVWEIRLVKP